MEGKIVWKFQTPNVDRFYITHATEQGTFLTSSTDGHHQVIEIDRARNYVWVFRNYRRPFSLHMTLENGFFKNIGEGGIPEHWTFATRLSEGGGKIIWDHDNKPRPVLGIELDRDGALFLQQAIALEPGAIYKVGGELRTEDVTGTACLQIDFFDIYGGSMYDDVAKMPSGEFFTDTHPWTADSFEVRVPQNATYGELRLFLNNSGRVFLKNVMLHKV
jgi:hypothetical protein